MSHGEDASGRRENGATWIADGEKYGLVALSVKVQGDIPEGAITSTLRVQTNTTLAIPSTWREWLGSIRSREVEDCNLFLFSKQASATPDILDAENAALKQLAWNFYTGLLLASPFAPAHRPVVLTGVRRDGDIDIRQQQDLDSPIPCMFRPYPAIGPEHIRLAAELGENLAAVPATQLSGGHWRLFRTLHVYTEARTTPDILDRLHQYTRCIDGLILSDAGNAKRQFKSRTEMFIGPRHHDLMGAIYDVRSAVEHLHENRYLESFDRDIRLDLLKKEAVVEHIARTALARIIGNRALWSQFANTTALAAFWALPIADRQRLWGSPIDPSDALEDFDPQYIHDGLLGAP